MKKAKFKLYFRKGNTIYNLANFKTAYLFVLENWKTIVDESNRVNLDKSKNARPKAAVINCPAFMYDKLQAELKNEGERLTIFYQTTYFALVTLVRKTITDGTEIHSEVQDVQEDSPEQ